MICKSSIQLIKDELYNNSLTEMFREFTISLKMKKGKIKKNIKRVLNQGFKILEKKVGLRYIMLTK